MHPSYHPRSRPPVNAKTRPIGASRHSLPAAFLRAPSIRDLCENVCAPSPRHIPAVNRVLLLRLEFVRKSESTSDAAETVKLSTRRLADLQHASSPSNAHLDPQLYPVLGFFCTRLHRSEESWLPPLPRSVQKPAPQNDPDHPHLPLERLGLRRRAHLLHRARRRRRHLQPFHRRLRPQAASSPSGSRASSRSPPPTPHSPKTISPGASSKRSRPTPPACSCPSSSARKAATAASPSKPTRATTATPRPCSRRPSASAGSRPT